MRIRPLRLALFAAALLAPLLGSAAAQAQSLVGRWLTVGDVGNGGRYAYTAMFYPNGNLAFQMAVTGGPNNPSGSGVSTCYGQYRYDGRYLSVRVDRGDGPAAPMCTNGMIAWGGPLRFLDQDTHEIGGTLWHRQ